MLGKIEGRKRRGWQRMRWLYGITDGHECEQALVELVMDREASRAGVHGVAKSWTQLCGWTELNWVFANGQNQSLTWPSSLLSLLSHFLPCSYPKLQAHRTPFSSYSTPECFYFSAFSRWILYPFPNISTWIIVFFFIFVLLLENPILSNAFPRYPIKTSILTLTCLTGPFSFLTLPLPLECISTVFSSVQSLSCVQLFATPWITACQASLSITNSRSSLRLMSIKSVMPSTSVVLFSSCPQSLPASVFSNESTLHMR